MASSSIPRQLTPIMVTRPGASQRSRKRSRALPAGRDIAARAQPAADQDSLLNVYRCQLGIDTRPLPDRCSNPPDTAPTPQARLSGVEDKF